MMSDDGAVEVPQTLEGWYILHDMYAVDWGRWRALDRDVRMQIASEATEWLTRAAGVEKGDTCLYSLLTQKGDLMLLHYRASPEAVNQVEFEMRQLRWFDYLRPTGSYLSVIELGLYELMGVVRKRLAEQGIRAGSDEYEQLFEAEMGKQKRRTESRLFRRIPTERYICFYPMNKRRGELANWYTLNLNERRDLMRSHGHIGQRYRDKVTQIIGGSVALDDWEWGVSLHADDALVFKKLVYEMRFDPASAIYAEFGTFTIGIRLQPDQLAPMLAGQLD